MKFRSASDTDPLDLNLIPLIDVLLVVLIFLAATSTFARQQQLSVELPRAQAEPSLAERHVLAISQDGRYALDGELIDSSSAAPLAASLQAQAEPGGREALLILADGQASHAAVVQAMEAARQAGLARIHFATQQP